MTTSEKPTNTVRHDWECYAPDLIFCDPDEWDSIPQEHKDLIDGMNGLNCDGGGVPGPWCSARSGCHYKTPRGYNVDNPFNKNVEDDPFYEWPDPQYD